MRDLRLPMLASVITQQGSSVEWFCISDPRDRLRTAGWFLYYIRLRRLFVPATENPCSLEADQLAPGFADCRRGYHGPVPERTGSAPRGPTAQLARPYGPDLVKDTWMGRRDS